MEFLRRSQAAQLIHKHKLIGFGAGDEGAKTQAFLDGKLEYFIDNSRDKWGREWEGKVPVKPVAALAEEQLDQLIVVICTEQYQIVAEQLRELYPGIKMYRSPLLKDFDIFDRLLNCSEHILLTAYGASGGIYLINGRTEKYTRLAAGTFRGLLQVGQRLFTATERGELWEIDSLDPFKYSVRYEPERLCQMHGLEYWENGNLILAAEAENDRISFIDAETFKKVDEFSVSHKPGRDNCHINDILVRDDTLFISRLSQSGWWKQGIYDGTISEMDLNKRREMTPILTGLILPHSIQFIGDNFYICESLTGRILTGKKYVVVQLNGFLRGMDGTEELLYIGQTRTRAAKDARQFYSPISMDSGLYVVNPETQIYRFIKLPEMTDVYNIFDLERRGLA